MSSPNIPVARFSSVGLGRLKRTTALPLWIAGCGVASLTAIATPAYADCTPAAANDVVASCTGSTPNQGTGAPGTSAGVDGYGQFALTNLTVGVANGATVTGAQGGVTFSTGTVNNAGTIVSTAAGSGAITGFNSVAFTTSGSVTGIDFGVGSNGPVTGTNSGAIAGIIGLLGTTVTLTNIGSITGSTDGAILSGPLNLTNSGTVKGADGFQSSGLTLTNSGSIIGTGGGNAFTFGYGAAMFSGTGTVVNTGTITGLNGGLVGFGVTPGSSILNVTNSGAITSTAAGDAVIAGTVNLSNAGQIIGQRNGVLGVAANVQNSGTIAGVAQGGVAGSSLSLANSGTIVGTIGVIAGQSGVITNAGTIIGVGGTAVRLSAASDSLSVLPGARFGGLVDFGGGADKVAFGAGSWILNTANFNSALSTVTTPGNPYFVTPNQIVVADVSGFGVQNRAIMDITGWIATVLPETPVFAGVSGGVANSFAQTSSTASPFAAFDSFASSDALGYAKAPVFKAASVAYADGSAMWAKGFGGERQQSTSGTFIGGVTAGYGGAIGYERLINTDLRIGGLIGGSANRTNLNQNAGSSNTDTVFGGIYGRNTWGPTFLDLAVIGGNLDNRNQRNIAGGLAAQTASASYGGWFVMPSLALGRRLDIDGRGFTITPALKVRYVDANFDGYTETGSTANLTVGSRTFQAFEERGELTFANTAVFGENRLTGRLTVGGLAQQRSGGGQVNIALLGQNFLAATPDRANVTGGFGGGGLDWQVGKVTLFAAGEAMASSDSTRTYSGRGGARFSW